MGRFRKKGGGPGLDRELYMHLCEVGYAGDPRDKRDLSVQACDIRRRRIRAHEYLEHQGWNSPEDARLAFEEKRKELAALSDGPMPTVVEEQKGYRKELMEKFPDWIGWTNPEWWREHLPSRDLVTRAGRRMMKTAGIKPQELTTQVKHVPKVDTMTTGADSLFESEADFRKRAAGDG